MLNTVQDLIWEGKFFGDGCSGELEERYRVYYWDMQTSCKIHIYRTKKVKGYFNLGDTASKEPITDRIGFLIKARNEKETDDHIRLPLYFTLVWREPYNGLNQGVAFWMPTCPAGFVALGGVMTDSTSYPQFGSCYCLAAEHVERASSHTQQYHYQIAGDPTLNRKINLNCHIEVFRNPGFSDPTQNGSGLTRPFLIRDPGFFENVTPTGPSPGIFIKYDPDPGRDG